MRKIVAIAIILFAVKAQAQLAKESGSIKYHHVVRASGEKQDLYKKAADWIAEDQGHVTNTVQISSEEKGEILVKGEFEHHSKTGLSHIQYICSFQFRDGMYKESYEDFKYVLLNGDEISFEDSKLKNKADIIKTTEAKITELTTGLKEYMNSQVVASN